MYKFIVQLDEERIIREGKYSVAKMWQKIEEIFDEFQAIKTIKDNGEREYVPSSARIKSARSDWACMLCDFLDLEWLGIYGKKLLYFVLNDEIGEDCLCDIREEYKLQEVNGIWQLVR